MSILVFRMRLREPQHRLLVLGWTAGLLLALSGCTSVRDYVNNGFKVGPNYAPPLAEVAEHWIDSADIRTHEGEDLSRWWTVFKDPTLDRLITSAYRQNLTLREAGFRVLEARAQRGIAVGEVFPQQQNATGSFQRKAVTTNTSGFSPQQQFYDQWNSGFNLAWELDFWGRFRRAVTAADAQLNASVEGYDDVLVTLLGDVATNYVQIRTLQARIRLLKDNVELQRWVVDLLKQRLGGGFRATKLDVDQGISTLEQTEAQIPELEIGLQQATNRLCVLMGTPPTDLQNLLGEDHIPSAAPGVVIGIPADLLSRRPDVRRARYLAAAQAEVIGIAQAELYPALSITGTLGWQANNFGDLFQAKSLNSNVGPAFQWNLLNYGRIVNNVRFQEAKFQELVLAYQQTVLAADQEVEDGLVTFLRAQRREKHLATSANAATDAVKTIFLQYQAGRADADFNRYALIEQNRVQQQDLLAQSRGEIALGLIQVYRALGGGWELRLAPESEGPSPPAAPPQLPPTPDEISLPPRVPQPPAKPELLPQPPPADAERAKDN
ncbi:MAG: TolC family protein [Planctomycetota bacterium]|nr:TolC family protein [Planctomycetota bacterium]